MAQGLKSRLTKMCDLDSTPELQQARQGPPLVLSTKQQLYLSRLSHLILAGKLWIRTVMSNTYRNKVP